MASVISLKIVRRFSADHFQPRKFSHHGEIDSAEAEARQQDVDAVSERLIVQRVDGFGDRFRTVGVGPSVFHFGVSFFDGHLQWRVGHGEGNEFLPVLAAREASGCFEALVERRCRATASAGRRWASPAARCELVASVRSATPTVSLSMPKMNEVMA